MVEHKKDGLDFFREHWSWMSYLVIFTISFILFLIYQSTPVFADPDSFYHVKMAVLIRDRGIIHDFPWLDLTVLGQHYTDQHFLYHVALIPFVTIWSPLVGLKLATVFFGAGLMTVVYWMLRQFHVQGAFWFVVILLLIRPFTFRINLAKAPSTSLIFLMVGLAFMFHHHLRRLFWLAFAYVWYYGGFAVLGVTAGVYASVSALYNRFVSRVNVNRLVDKMLSLVGRHARRHRRRWPNVVVLAVTISGLVAGMIIHPYFPANLNFYYHQLINIGIINFRDVIGVGAEWYSYNFVDLAANGAFASLLILCAVMGIVLHPRQQSKRSITLGVLTVFFLILTLKSRRYVEYYIPIAVLFSAFSLNDSWQGIDWGQVRAQTRIIMRQWWARLTLYPLAAVILAGILYIAGRDVVGQMKDLRSGYSPFQYTKSSAWLIANTPAGSRVVHSDWDEFPLLFYHNDHNRYIVGLDPTFLYKANEDVYWTWVNITLGKYQGDVYQAVVNTLQSRYVFVTSDHQTMDNLFRHHPKFQVRYQDDEVTIYEAAPSSVAVLSY